MKPRDRRERGGNGSAGEGHFLNYFKISTRHFWRRRVVVDLLIFRGRVVFDLLIFRGRVVVYLLIFSGRVNRFLSIFSLRG